MRHAHSGFIPTMTQIPQNQDKVEKWEQNLPFVDHTA